MYICVRTHHPDPRNQGFRVPKKLASRSEACWLSPDRPPRRQARAAVHGIDWSDRYPLITESAFPIRSTSFVLDGEAGLLGVDGIFDFEGLYSRKRFNGRMRGGYQ